MKRVSALFLAVILCVSLLPVNALAEEGSIAPAEEPVFAGTIALTAEEPTAEIAETALPEEEEPAVIQEAATAKEEETDAEGVIAEETEEAGTFAVASGTCGDNVTWTLSDEGLLTISGTGAIWDFPEEYPSFYDLRESITSAVIEPGVTSLGSYLFYNCTVLASVTIGSDVASIGESTFGVYGTGTSLTEITFTGSAPSFGNDCFFHVNATAYYPAGDATWTEDIRQNYGGSIIWVAVGGMCGDNVNWMLDGGTLTIRGTGDMWDFSGSSHAPWYDDRADITAVTIQSGVTNIGAYAFSDCTALTDVTIPNGVTAIGARAFYSTAITSVFLPHTVKSIAFYAFANTKLASVSIPPSVTSIESGAFALCRMMTNIAVTDGNSAYTASDNVLFSKNMKTLHTFPGGKSGSYTIPDGVTRIGDYAFYDCDGLTGTVTIPRGVTEIGMCAFDNCSGIKSVEMPNTLTSLEASAFAYSTLTEILFSGNAPTFGYNVFKNVTAKAYYPPAGSWTDSVRQNYGGTITWTAWGPTVFLCGDDLFWEVIGSTLIITGTGDMWDFSNVSSQPWYSKREGINKVELPEGLTSIGNYAFASFSKLTSVTIPNGVTSIGENAFIGSEQLTSVTIPDSVTSIGEYAFYNCIKLKNITIPGSVTSIEKYVFSYCTNLKSAVLSEGITTTGNGLFFGCTALTEVTLPQSLITIEDGAFYNCKKLQSITIPAAVTAIVDTAFYYCESLTSVAIPASVTAIGSGAFNFCSSLKTITFEGSAPAFNGTSIFTGVTATAYYPANNPTWTESVRQDYGGTITWVTGANVPLATLAASTRGITVRWTEIPGTVKYQVQRSTDGGKWKSLGTVTELYLLDSDVFMNVKYAYRVRAYVSGAWGDWSDAVETLFNPFEDVSGNKTIGYVAWAYNNGIVSGTSETTFSPDANCTRIQFVMMLWKMNGSPTVTGVENPFKDITNGTKSCKAVLWALKTGIINAGKSFNPNGNITRSQVVMILWKMAGEPKVTGVTNPFTDITDGTKLCKAVLWAYKNGITTGTSATKFSPDNNCTRVQLVVFLYKST